MKPGLWEYLLKRLLLAAFTLFLILLVSYVLLRFAPGDPVKSSMIGSGGAGATGLSVDKPELTENEVLKKKLNFDKPVIVGFWLWLKDVVCHGDFGTSASFDKGRPVTELILERLPVTLRLNLCAIFLIYLFAIPIGLFSGVFPEGKFDKITTAVLFFCFPFLCSGLHYPCRHWSARAVFFRCFRLKGWNLPQRKVFPHGRLPVKPRCIIFFLCFV